MYAAIKQKQPVPTHTHASNLDGADELSVVEVIFHQIETLCFRTLDHRLRNGSFRTTGSKRIREEYWGGMRGGSRAGSIGNTP